MMIVVVVVVFHEEEDMGTKSTMVLNQELCFLILIQLDLLIP